MATLTTSYQMLDQKLLGTDDYGAKLYIRIYAKYSEQDITNNRSKVQYQARAYFDKSWSIWDRQSNGSVSGTSATTKTFSRSADYGSGETTLDTTEAWVSHNNDGTMSISASANLKFPNWGWNNTASGTADLPTIPRASKISATSANIEETSQIAVTRYSDNFRHVIAFSFGSLSGYILEDGTITQTLTKLNATAINFQIPADWYNEIPNATEGTCTLTITTYNGNDIIGQNSCTFYARVGGNVAVNGSVIDTNATTLALTGNSNILVKGYSNAKVTWSATPTPGASLSNVKINNNNVSSSPYSFVLNDTQISIIATDSRGKTNSSNPYHPVFTLKDYFRPNLATVLERENPTSGNAKLSFQGTWFNKSFGAVANTLTIVWKYRESGAANWIDGGTLVQNTDYKVNGNNVWSGIGDSKSDITIGNDVLNYEKAWDILISVTDKLASYTIIGTITKGVPIANWEEEFFNINGKFNIYGITFIKHIANILWPVDSIYMSLSQDLPAFLSGEWSLLDTLVNGGHTYYIYKRTSEDELLYYNNDNVLYSNDDIYIDNNLLKGDDVL